MVCHPKLICYRNGQVTLVVSSRVDASAIDTPCALHLSEFGKHYWIRENVQFRQLASGVDAAES